jgi:peptide/nickel transport system substrate-binding protein
MRIAISSSQGSTLDPAHPDRLFEALDALYDYLVREGASFAPEPQLAESWDVNATGDRWQFKLRRGVTFHNGRSFSSADVRYTFQRIFDAKLASPAASVLAPSIDPKRIRTPSPDEVIFELRQPHSELPVLLYNYRLGIVPDGSGSTIGKSGIGTGPFKLSRFDPTEATTFTANREYWDGRPLLDGVRMVVMGESKARVNALLGDQIDLDSTTQDPPSVRLLQAAKGCVVKERQEGGWDPLNMRVARKPFSDLRVRQAFKLATDDRLIIQRALNGDGVVAGDNPIANFDPYYVSTPREHDPEKARALLRQAGYADGIDVTLATSPYNGSMIPLSTAVQQVVKPAGINVRLKQADPSSYWSGAFKQASFAASGFGGRPCDQLLNEVYRRNAPNNETGWASERFETLLDAARAELEPARRKQIYADAQRLLHAESAALIAYHTIVSYGMRDRVVGFPGAGALRRFDYHKLGLRA